jgi:hypothetical protein
VILSDGEKNAILKFHKSEKCRFNFREKFSNAIVEGGKNYRLACINAIVRRDPMILQLVQRRWDN